MSTGRVYGSLYFSAVASMLFYGAACIQTYFYYGHYQDDHLCLKISVVVLWALDTTCEALVVTGAYKYFMAGLQGSPSMLDGIPELILLPTVLISIVSQGFFIYRIYVFSRKKVFVPLVWIVLAILQLVTTTISTWQALNSLINMQVTSFGTLSADAFTPMGMISLSIGAGVDVLIAAFLTCLLVRERSATGFKSTGDTLQYLIVFAVNTGIWTATFALLTVILLRLYPSTLLYIVPGFQLPSLYCNTVLANLNVRAYVRPATTVDDVGADMPAPRSRRGAVP